MLFGVGPLGGALIFSLSLSHFDTVRRRRSVNQEEGHGGTLILDTQPPEQ